MARGHTRARRQVLAVAHRLNTVDAGDKWRSMSSAKACGADCEALAEDDQVEPTVGCSEGFQDGVVA